MTNDNVVPQLAAALAHITVGVMCGLLIAPFLLAALLPGQIHKKPARHLYLVRPAHRGN